MFKPTSYLLPFSDQTLKKSCLSLQEREEDENICKKYINKETEKEETEPVQPWLLVHSSLFIEAEALGSEETHEGVKLRGLRGLAEMIMRRNRRSRRDRGLGFGGDDDD